MKDKKNATNKFSKNKHVLVEMMQDANYMVKIIDSIPYSLYVVNLDYTIALANLAAKKKGVEPGRYCYEVTHGSQSPCEKEHGCPLKKVVELKKTVFVEHMHYNNKGKPRYVEVFGAPVFDREGRVRQVIEASFDITKRKKAEKILEDYHNRLKSDIQAQTDELEKVHKAFEDRKRLADIGALAATLAHELRNPLAGIKLAAYSINKKKTDSALDDHLFAIDQTIGDCEAIIRNFLSYSTVKMPSYQSAVISDLLKECVRSVGDRYAKWQVEVNTIFHCRKNQRIECDIIQIKELFLNILDNSYQSFSKMKGRLEIIVDIDKPKEHLSIFFKNNGAMITKKDLKLIFRPFYTTKIRGIGLGLTLCKQVVERHNGAIDIESKKNTGTIVKIVLPVKGN